MSDEERWSGHGCAMAVLVVLLAISVVAAIVIWLEAVTR